MILSDLRNYIKQRHKVALIDLINHFQVDADVLRDMLGKWISKGKIRKLTLESNCGTSCCQCDPALTEIYEWVD